MILDREQILSQRLATEKIDIPWLEDSQIIVRALPHHVLDQSSHDGDHQQYVFVNAVVDESGSRIYTDDEAAKVGEIVDRSLIELVVSAAYRLSVIPKERQEAIKKNWSLLVGDESGE